MLAFSFYDAVVAVHIMAIVVAFGVTFTYPLVVPYMLRDHPRSVPALHRMQVLVGRRIITPAATVALLAGIWLASDGDWWAEAWVQIGFGVLVLLLGMVGAFFSPRETRLAELAQRDLEAAGGEAIEWSEEYRDAARTVAIGGTVASVLVLVVIFMMATRWPG